MMSEPDEPFGEFSGLSDFPPPDISTREQLDFSGRPPGTPFQERLMDAVSGSEFRMSFEHGAPVRRRGEALSISYDQAMDYLWPSEYED